MRQLWMTAFALMAIHGLFLSVVLAFGRAASRANRWLAVLLLTISLIALAQALSASGLMIRRPHLIGVTFPLWYWVGPLVLAYFAALLNPGGADTRLAVLLGVGATVIVALFVVPFYLQPASEKVAHLRNGFAPAATINGLYVLLAVYGAVSGISLVNAYVRLSRYERRASEERSDIALWRVRWVRHLLIVAGMVIASDVITTVVVLATGRFGSLWSGIPAIALMALIFAVGWAVLVYPDQLFQPISSRATSTPCPAGVELDRDLIAALTRVIGEEHLYRNPNLSLGDLSAHLGTSRHRVSEVINRDFGVSFYDFINEHRVRDVERRLEVGESKTVVAIAYEAGFNSSASFYRAFKKHTGMTPSAYIKGSRGHSGARSFAMTDQSETPPYSKTVEASKTG